jgi:peptidoglycan hydrolase CwlO-like protein
MKTAVHLIIALLFIACNESIAPKKSPQIPERQNSIAQEMVKLRCEAQKFRSQIESLRQQKNEKETLEAANADNPAKLAEIEKEFAQYTNDLEALRIKSQEISNLMQIKTAEYFQPAAGDTVMKRLLHSELNSLFKLPCPE